MPRIVPSCSTHLLLLSFILAVKGYSRIFSNETHANVFLLMLVGYRSHSFAVFDFMCFIYLSERRLETERARVDESPALLFCFLSAPWKIWTM